MKNKNLKRSKNMETFEMREESGDPLSDEKFLEKKRAFFVKIGLSVRNSLRIHKEQGLWGDADENWRRVSKHCIVEVARASVFAEKFGLLEETKNNLIEAAALHDFYKKKEIKSAGSTGLTWENMRRSSLEADKIMRAKGVKKDVIELVDSVGLGALENIERILKKKRLSEKDIASLVLHYIDAYTKETDWAKVAEGDINAMDLRINDGAINPKYRPVYEKEYSDGETVANAQSRIDHSVQEVLAGMLRKKTAEEVAPQDMPYLIDQDIIKRINS